jgi:hypothetical protein
MGSTSDQSGLLPSIENWFSGQSAANQAAMTPFIGQAAQSATGGVWNTGSVGNITGKFESALQGLANISTPSPFMTPEQLQAAYAAHPEDYPANYNPATGGLNVDPSLNDAQWSALNDQNFMSAPVRIGASGNAYQGIAGMGLDLPESGMSGG